VVAGGAVVEVEVGLDEVVVTAGAVVVVTGAAGAVVVVASFFRSPRPRPG
jgi:hypothetical protein